MNQTSSSNALTRANAALYRRHFDAGAMSCFYCGHVRECLDHRPPLAALAHGADELNALMIPLVLLPCCCDCRRITRGLPLLTAGDALNRIAMTLEARYERLYAIKGKGDASTPLQQRLALVREATLGALMQRIRFAQERQLDDYLMPVWEAADE